MRIYLDVRRETEECNFGCSHNVTYYEVAIVEEALRIIKDTFYGPTPTGKGYDVFYRDALTNELYFREATWDGPSNILIDSQERLWTIRPFAQVAKNISGDLIIPEWKK